jgi:hypothetical protein
LRVLPLTHQRGAVEEPRLAICALEAQRGIDRWWQLETDRRGSLQVPRDSATGVTPVSRARRTAEPFGNLKKLDRHSAIPLRARRWSRRWFLPSIRRGWINDGTNLGNRIGRESAHLGMLAHKSRVRSDVHAVNLVIGHVALHPLNPGAELVQYTARFLGNPVQVRRRKFPGTGNFTLDHKLWHFNSPFWSPETDSQPV